MELASAHLSDCQDLPPLPGCFLHPGSSAAHFQGSVVCVQEQGHNDQPLNGLFCLVSLYQGEDSRGTSFIIGQVLYQHILLSSLPAAISKQQASNGKCRNSALNLTCTFPLDYILLTAHMLRCFFHTWHKQDCFL